MRDQPEPTPEEQELTPERQQEEEAKAAPGHEQPDRVPDELDDDA